MDRANVSGVDLEYEVRGEGKPAQLIDMLIADCFVPLVREPALADRYELISDHRQGAGADAVSLPLGGPFLEAAGPMFEACGSGDHSGTFAVFVAAARGLDWKR